MDITFLVVVELSHATKPRREVLSYSWRMDSSCLRLNLTGLSRKIMNNLQKRGLEKTNVTISIEVVNANDPEFVQDTVALDMDLKEGCLALQQRNSNAPFLVTKYYDENLLSTLQFTDGEVESSPNRQQKRQSDEVEITDDQVPTTATPDSSTGCGLVPLKVNLTKIFGEFVVLPKEIDIKDCYGSCNAGRNSESFTIHSTIKEQVKLIEGTDHIQRSELCCTPASYEHKELLIQKENYVALVIFPNMAVSACHCV